MSERDEFERWVREDLKPAQPNILLEWSHGMYVEGTAHLMFRAFRGGKQARADQRKQEVAELVELLHRCSGFIHDFPNDEGDLELDALAKDLRAALFRHASKAGGGDE